MIRLAGGDTNAVVDMDSGVMREIVKFEGVIGAVNEITVRNAVTGEGPSIEPTGDDADIDLVFSGQGDGAVRIESNKTHFATGGEGGSGMTLFVKTLGGLADNTNNTLCTLTIPNAIHGGLLEITVTGVLGDGDSTESKKYLISLSRIAGADTKRTIGTAFGTAQTTGATANATVTVSLGTLTGAVGATQTLTINVKVARSAGASSNHVIVAEVKLLNAIYPGITIA